MERTAGINHPYYPSHVSVPHYAPNETPVSILLGAFAGLLSIVIFTALALARRANPGLNWRDQLTFSWFVLCGTLHCFFEGFFVLYHESLASRQDLFGQLWKEYALSDSRYLTSDPFMLAIEAVTVAVWGPCCYATAVCIARNSSLRHPLQLVVSVAHLYGVALYYLTCSAEWHFNGISHSRPEFLYYWVYYVGFNAPWVVVPTMLLFGSIKRIRSKDHALRDINRLIRKSQLVNGNHESKKTR